MAKGKSTRREFDWRAYSKPPRLLTAEQEAACEHGPLSPLLDWARTTDFARFEIRARHAAIYYAGTMLLRVRENAPGRLVGEIDANTRVPRGERSGAEQLETWPLVSAGDVNAAVAELNALREIDVSHGALDSPSERGILHAFASDNQGVSGIDPDYVVADTEFQYGKRRFDFVAMRRAEGVGGLAGFTTPRLVVGQLKSGERPLAGSSGLLSHATDLVEFAQALGGEHLARARAELDELVRQKLRLGLLNTQIPFRHFTEDDPEYLLVFTGMDVASPALDAPLSQVHDKLVARHYQHELLRFAAVGGLQPAPLQIESMALSAGADLGYREFKRYRKELRTDAPDHTPTKE